MKTKLATLALITLFSAGASTGALAHQDTSEAGSYHNLQHVIQQPSTPETVKQERESQKSSDWGKDNHEEGTGGHGLHEAMKMKPATEEQMKLQREKEKTLDRGKDNHEEGVGGHGLYEAGKGR